MLQRTHFELVIEKPALLSKHKKRARRTKRNRRKSKRTAVVINKFNENSEYEDKVKLTRGEGSEVLSLMQGKGSFMSWVVSCKLQRNSKRPLCQSRVWTYHGSSIYVRSGGLRTNSTNRAVLQPQSFRQPRYFESIVGTQVLNSSAIENLLTRYSTDNTVHSSNEFPNYLVYFWRHFVEQHLI